MFYSPPRQPPQWNWSSSHPFLSKPLLRPKITSLSLSLSPVTTGPHNQITPFRCLTKFQSLKGYGHWNWMKTLEHSEKETQNRRSELKKEGKKPQKQAIA
ncbi:hypothetical protein RchiOBHm_Chr4g0418851 [Rosa chinensis]|uniref:Uncharacterized protein n=1 Tax=Rosa chinensis TaxID=74649 RepID=A0A2P6QXP3_ROSCH|nr:hypothetical protein RchiOBHm_Chr4g0418851 [Rosa chinensis]